MSSLGGGEGRLSKGSLLGNEAGDEQGLMPEGFGFQSQSDEKPQEDPEKEHNMLSSILGRFP